MSKSIVNKLQKSSLYSPNLFPQVIKSVAQFSFFCAAKRKLNESDSRISTKDNFPAIQYFIHIWIYIRSQAFSPVLGKKIRQETGERVAKRIRVAKAMYFKCFASTGLFLLELIQAFVCLFVCFWTERREKKSNQTTVKTSFGNLANEEVFNVFAEICCPR